MLNYFEERKETFFDYKKENFSKSKKSLFFKAFKYFWPKMPNSFFFTFGQNKTRNNA